MRICSDSVFKFVAAIDDKKPKAYLETRAFKRD